MRIKWQQIYNSHTHTHKMKIKTKRKKELNSSNNEYKNNKRQASNKHNNNSSKTTFELEGDFTKPAMHTICTHIGTHLILNLEYKFSIYRPDRRMYIIVVVATLLSQSKRDWIK